MNKIIPKQSLTILKVVIEVPTKWYVDSSHENSRHRLDLSWVFNDQDKELDNIRLTNLKSITVTGIPYSDNDPAN